MVPRVSFYERAGRAIFIKKTAPENPGAEASGTTRGAVDSIWRRLGGRLVGWRELVSWRRQIRRRTQGRDVPPPDPPGNRLHAIHLHRVHGGPCRVVSVYGDALRLWRPLPDHYGSLEVDEGLLASLCRDLGNRSDAGGPLKGRWEFPEPERVLEVFLRDSQERTDDPCFLGIEGFLGASVRHEALSQVDGVAQ